MEPLLTALPKRPSSESGLRRWFNLHTLPPCRLGITGLPIELGQLQIGGVYALLATPSPALHACIRHTLEDYAHHPSVLIHEKPTELIADVSDKPFYFFEIPEDFSQRIKKKGLQSFLYELEAYHIPFGSTVFIVGAEALFNWTQSGHLKNEMSLLVNWFKGWKHRGVLCFNPEAAHESLNSVLRTLQHFLSGAVELAAEEGQFHWKVDFWTQGKNLILGREYPLRFTQEGRLTLEVDTPDAGLLLAPDESRVVCLRGAVSQESWLPPHWEIFDSYSELHYALNQAMASSILLIYSREHPLNELALAIYTLRKKSGRSIKILVRCIKDALRHHQELLLLRLGANLVVSQGTPFSRVLSLLDSIQGQVFARSLPADFESAISSAVTISASGYIPLPDFIEGMKSALEKSRALGISNLLLKFRLHPHIPHLTALQACILRRPGDICSTDANHVYVFLFACRLSDIEVVIQRIFSTPIPELFVNETRSADVMGQEAVVSELTHVLEQGELIDYRPFLKKEAPPHLKASFSETTVSEHEAHTEGARTLPDPELDSLPALNALSLDKPPRTRDIQRCILPLKSVLGYHV